MNTIWAVVREGKIVPLEKVDVPEVTKALVTLMPEEETDFWLAAGEPSLGAVWDNAGDDVYAELLER